MQPNQQQQQQFQQQLQNSPPHQQQQHNVNGLSTNDIQNLQALNALKLFQQQQHQQQQQQAQQKPLQMPMMGLNQLFQNYSPNNSLKNWPMANSSTPSTPISQQPPQHHGVSSAQSTDANLDRLARFHRSSAGNLN